jgi:tetratricopeptide (TPR) repeat protein
VSPSARQRFHRRWQAVSLCLWLVLPGAIASASEPKAEVKARLVNLEQHLNDWDIVGAKVELAALEQAAPNDIEPLEYYRGRIAFEEGDYAKAVKSLTAAGLQDKPGSYLKLAQETQDIIKGHQRVESEHFVFLYPAGKDEVLAPYALEALEAIRSALQKDLGHVPPGKVRVEVVNDARELARVSTLTLKQIRTTGTIAICKFSKLMVTSPKAVLRGYDWMDTLAHEYIHLVVSQKGKNAVPIWLHEGLAKYLESRWRGAPGQAMSPSTLSLLGERVKKDKLIPFEKMHPSIALLPSAEDAATAFAEVFFAIDLIYKEHGTDGLRAVIDNLAKGNDDRQSVEKATGKTFSAFEKAWLAHIRKQPFPRELIPLTDEKKVLKDDAPGRAQAKEQPKGKEISFGDFADVEEVEARRFAHLGELLRERRRVGAAAEEYGKAHKLVGSKYESVSNKYALALLELQRFDEAEQVLLSSLKIHPGSPATQVHLGRIYLHRRDFPRAKQSYLDALSSDPFDEEIHFALLRVALEEKDDAAAKRTRRAAVVLTGVAPEKADLVARALGLREGTTAAAPADAGERARTR